MGKACCRSRALRSVRRSGGHVRRTGNYRAALVPVSRLRPIAVDQNDLRLHFSDVSPARPGRRASAATGKDALGRALGHQPRQARDAAGLSRAQVYAATGVSESHIEKIELGDVADPGVFIVAALARASGIPVDRVLRAAEQEVARTRAAPRRP